MTTNQLIAMCFPVLTAAVVGATGLLVSKWTKVPADESQPLPDALDPAEAYELLGRADRLIRDVQHQLVKS
jgi:hypothetical protein